MSDAEKREKSIAESTNGLCQSGRGETRLRFVNEKERRVPLTVEILLLQRKRRGLQIFFNHRFQKVAINTS